MQKITIAKIPAYLFYMGFSIAMLVAMYNTKNTLNFLSVLMSFESIGFFTSFLCVVLILKGYVFPIRLLSALLGVVTFFSLFVFVGWDESGASLQEKVLWIVVCAGLLVGHEALLRWAGLVRGN